MARIPAVTCTPCGKRLYRSEQEARAALGLAMNGVWSGRSDRERLKDYAIHPYRCEHRKGWHIGHNPRTIKAIETWRESRNPQPA